MRLIRIAVVILVPAVTTGACIVAFFFLALWTDPCDTTKHTCDISPLAGIAAGLIVGPIAGFLLAKRALRLIPLRSEPLAPGRAV
jgi:hypothetical protein